MEKWSNVSDKWFINYVNENFLNGVLEFSASSNFESSEVDGMAYEAFWQYSINDSLTITPGIVRQTIEKQNDTISFMLTSNISF